jgi:hypothetical protein
MMLQVFLLAGVALADEGVQSYEKKPLVAKIHVRCHEVENAVVRHERLGGVLIYYERGPHRRSAEFWHTTPCGILASQTAKESAARTPVRNWRDAKEMR